MGNPTDSEKHQKMYKNVIARYEAEIKKPEPNEPKPILEYRIKRIKTLLVEK